MSVPSGSGPLPLSSGGESLEGRTGLDLNQDDDVGVHTPRGYTDVLVTPRGSGTAEQLSASKPLPLRLRVDSVVTGLDFDEGVGIHTPRGYTDVIGTPRGTVATPRDAAGDASVRLATGAGEETLRKDEELRPLDQVPHGTTSTGDHFQHLPSIATVASVCKPLRVSHSLTRHITRQAFALAAEDLTTLPNLTEEQVLFGTPQPAI